MSAPVCPTCGRPLDLHDRHVRMHLPDPVLAVPPEERPARTWGNDTHLQVQGVGAFVRVLLPIRLTGGFSLTVGTWLAIDPADFRSVWEEWDTESYSSLVLEGFLANAIPPWGDAVLGAPATAAVRDPKLNPYIASSEHLILGEVLATEWPHEEVLAPYDGLLEQVRQP
jgi:hypothetical protein